MMVGAQKQSLGWGSAGTLCCVVAAAYSPSLWAAMAGRVEFSDGNAQILRKGGALSATRGMELESGDEIDTRAGRVQVRFTDGAYVSLSPGSSFKIENYKFNGKADGEEKGFFSLLKGGMRTVTGLIGKANRQSYQVKTPTATIGIRGTGYSIQLLPNGIMLVHINSGQVVVTTPQGEQVFKAGQTAVVRPGDVARNDSGEVLNPSSGPLNSGAILSNEQRTTTGGSVAAPTPTPTPSVTPTPAPTPLPPLSSGPGYAVAWAHNPFTDAGGVGVAAITQVDSSATATTDASKFMTGFTNLAPADFLIGGFARHDEGTDGTYLSWGRWGLGSPAPGKISNRQPSSNSLGSFHYVMGQPTLVRPTTGQFGYTVLGKTAPTTGAGSVGLFTLNGLMVDFAAASIKYNYSVAIGLDVANMDGSGTFSGSLFSGSSTGSSIGTGICYSTGCTGTERGFIAGTNGERLGFSYSVFDQFNNRYINGAAALTQGTLPAARLFSGSGYTVSYAHGNITGSAGQGQAVGVPATMNSSGHLTGFNQSGSLYEVGGFTRQNDGGDGLVSWGRWTTGTGTLFNGTQTIATNNTAFHYVVGKPTVASSLPTSGNATYTAIGSTAPTNDINTGTFTLNSMSVNFSSSSLSYIYTVQMGVNSAVMNNSGATYFSGSKPHFSGTSIGTGALCSGTCSGSEQGFFAGPTGERIGMNYKINTNGSNGIVTGAAAFSR